MDVDGELRGLLPFIDGQARKNARWLGLRVDDLRSVLLEEAWRLLQAGPWQPALFVVAARRRSVDWARQNGRYYRGGKPRRFNAVSLDWLIELLGDGVARIAPSFAADDDSSLRVDEQVDARRLLEPALAELTEPERTAVVAFYGADERLRSIGERIGYSESGVCMLNRRALAKLRARMQVA